MRLLSALVLIITLYNGAFSQPPDYQKIFGSDWEKALAFEKENRHWIQPVLNRNHIPYDLAVAVIFPELVRYSALRDKMEITLLKALYINLGEQYADFSIGPFQIKPSFAEIIRREGPSVLGRRSGIYFRQPEDFENISDFRKSIVTDLEKAETEFNYVAAFWKICEKKYKTEKMTDKEKIIFIATAYNHGISRSAEEIKLMADKKFFNTKLFKTQNYSYSEVAIFWYENYRTGLIDPLK